MKFTLLVSLLLLSVLPAFAEECRLKKPLPLPGGVIPADGIAFRHALTDVKPRFTDPDGFREGDELNLYVFPVTIAEDKDPAKTYIGAAVTSEGHSEPLSVGHAYLYFGFGRDSFVAEKRVTDGESVQSLFWHSSFWPIGGPEDPAFGCKICGSGDALTHTTVKTRDGALTSVQLTFPVELNWTNDKGETIVIYTGEHQTLCVTNADLKPVEPKASLRPRKNAVRGKIAR